MLTHYKNNWKHNCGILIGIDGGSFSESKDCEGFTHFAEHIMFAGTNKYTRPKLQNQYNLFLNELEATTSREDVKLFCYFDIKDFDASIDILKQMLFDWRCEKKYFKEEKDEILSEMKDFFKSRDHRELLSALRLLPISKKSPLGTINKIKKVSYKDLASIKEYWDKLLNEHNRGVVVVSGGISKKQLETIKKIFVQEKTKKISPQKWKFSESKLRYSKNISALFFKSNSYHPYSILYDQILHLRKNKNKSYSKFEYDNLYLQNISAFYLYDDEKKLDSLKKIKTFFLKPISKEEFNENKQLFLRSTREVLECVNIIGTLHWIWGFNNENYYGIKTNDPKKIYKYFENISYENFMKFMKEITDKIVIDRKGS